MYDDDMIENDICCLEQWYNIKLEHIKLLYSKTEESYSDSWILVIYEDGGKYYCMNDLDVWKPYEISQEDALEEILEFERLNI